MITIMIRKPVALLRSRLTLDQFGLRVCHHHVLAHEDLDHLVECLVRYLDLLPLHQYFRLGDLGWCSR